MCLFIYPDKNVSPPTTYAKVNKCWFFSNDVAWPLQHRLNFNGKLKRIQVGTFRDLQEFLIWILKSR